MKSIQTELLVIGGGATGTGVLRDLAMRGFKSVLVERSDLATGTTGRYHGLLHSGGRYVVKDPQAARECIEENRVLRRIMPQCIEDTGGFFVVTPWDDPGYAPRFVEGCTQAGIPVEEVPISLMLREEEFLNPRITHCYRVPDAAADSWLAADLNVKSAEEHGSTVLKYHEVKKLLREGDRVVGALCLDLVTNEELTIWADFVVNASGAWAGLISKSAGITVQIMPGKGVMLAANRRFLNTVVNRCKLPADGDIFVPIHTVTVIGTTDVKVSDPDKYAIEPWEIRLMLDEGEKLVPGFKQMRILRAWAGVRPLFQETRVSDTRDITRAYVLLDHEERDGVTGIVTITSGKWTTYRRMAEVTVDMVCEKLRVKRACRTHLEPLPDNRRIEYHTLGARLAKIESEKSYGNLICECELATYEDVVQAILQGEAKTIDDIRRDVRLGMGPCQGGFCTYRATGLLHRNRRPAVQETNVMLRDYLQERWKGLLPILWGQQLRQERLNLLIYQSLLNTHRLPGQKTSPLGPEMYQGVDISASSRSLNLEEKTPSRPSIQTRHFRTEVNPAPAALDVLVIGAGLAGLVAAWQAVQKAMRVRVISKGLGSLFWHTGCVDVLGYEGKNEQQFVTSPRSSILRLIEENPHHPYALAGLDSVAEAIEALKKLCREAGYPLHGSIEENWLLPTALGTVRPTCLAPEMMMAGDLRRSGSILVVGFEQYADFYPKLIADNLREQGFHAVWNVLDVDKLRERRFVTSRVLADMFEHADFRTEIVSKLRNNPDLAAVNRVGFPAVLGFEKAGEVKADLEQQLGLPVFEIPTLPPSIPGIRLHRLLVSAIEKGGGRVFDGMNAISAEVDEKQIRSVISEASVRPKLNRASRYILATGGYLGGGFEAGPFEDSREMVFGLPLAGYPNGEDWFSPEFLADDGHPIFRSGIRVNPDFQPTNDKGETVYENLYVTGSALAFCDPILERSVEGVALVSGYLVGRQSG